MGHKMKIEGIEIKGGYNLDSHQIDGSLYLHLDKNINNTKVIKNENKKEKVNRDKLWRGILPKDSKNILKDLFIYEDYLDKGDTITIAVHSLDNFYSPSNEAIKILLNYGLIELVDSSYKAEPLEWRGYKLTQEGTRLLQENLESTT